MNQLIGIAAVEDNQILVDGLRTWAYSADIYLAVVTATVDELLNAPAETFSVVLLDVALRANPDPDRNVRRLIAAGHRVLAIDWSGRPACAERVLAAGAHGYFTRHQEPAALTRLTRAVASGQSEPPAESIARADVPLPRPALSEREHYLLEAYTSGMTLDSAARHLGISPETAKTYLKRVKAKYRRAGLPVYTKLDLAELFRLGRSPNGKSSDHRIISPEVAGKIRFSERP
jgi:two-component system nitrate/nitrite response regulator NarL